MDFDFGADDDVDEFAAEVDGDGGQDEAYQRDCLLFLIDARAPMLERTEDGADPPLVQALTGVLSCMRERIVGTSSRDMIGVVLYGTEHSKSPAGVQTFDSMYTLVDIDVPSASAMRDVQKLLHGRDFCGAFGHSSAPFETANALWYVSILLNSAERAKKCARRVFLLTNDDGSAASDTARQRALQRVSDLNHARAWIEPFFFRPPARPFELGDGSFWREVLTQVRSAYRPAEGDDVPAELEVDRSDSWVDTCVAASSAELFDRLRRTQHTRRSNARLDLQLADGLDLSVQLLSLVRPFAKPAAKKCHAKTNEELTTSTTIMCKTHGSLLTASDTYRGWDFGGQWALFDHYEVSAFNADLGGRGIRLLGFKPRERLKLYHNMRPSMFVEPTETRPGSTAAVASLVGAMIAKDRIAICRYRRASEPPRLVALLPQPREPADSARARIGVGFHMVHLPWSDEVRRPELPEALPTSAFSDEQLERARDLVRGLALPVQADTGRDPGGPSSACAELHPALQAVTNPAAHRHYAWIEYLAVPGSVLEETVDRARPDEAWLAERAPALDSFKRSFDVADGDGRSDGPAKKPRAPKADVPSGLADWLVAHARGELHTHTVARLKDFCKEQSLPTSGKKDDLLGRIRAFLDQRAAEEEATLAASAAEGTGA